MDDKTGWLVDDEQVFILEDDGERDTRIGRSVAHLRPANADIDDVSRAEERTSFQQNTGSCDMSALEPALNIGPCDGATLRPQTLGDDLVRAVRGVRGTDDQ